MLDVDAREPVIRAYINLLLLFEMTPYAGFEAIGEWYKQYSSEMNSGTRNKSLVGFVALIHWPIRTPNQYRSIVCITLRRWITNDLSDETPKHPANFTFHNTNGRAVGFRK